METQEKKWTKRQQALIERHTKERQAKPQGSMLTLLEWDPDFFEQYVNFSGHPWRKGVLPPKVKELIYIAIDAATTHLYNKGTGAHIWRALEQGATKEEILEVLELTTAIGIHSCTEGLPILAEVYEKWSERKGKKRAV